MRGYTYDCVIRRTDNSIAVPLVGLRRQLRKARHEHLVATMECGHGRGVRLCPGDRRALRKAVLALRAETRLAGILPQDRLLRLADLVVRHLLGVAAVLS